jgi:hypothetical protein
MADKITIMKNALPQKMSEVLLDFAKPLLESIDMSDERVLEPALQMAVFIWNYAVIKSGHSPKTLGDGFTREIKRTVKARRSSDPIFRTVLETLLERKKSLYPNNNRMIADFNIRWDNIGKDMKLTVICPD